MTNLDIWLEKLGLCRLSFYRKMKQGYAQIISMKTRQVQRLQDKILQKDLELAQLREDLAASQKLLNQRAHIRDVG